MAGYNKRSLDIFRREAEQEEENLDLERQNAENEFTQKLAEKKRKLEAAAKEQRISESTLKMIEELAQDAQVGVASAHADVRAVQRLRVKKPAHMIEMERLLADPDAPPQIPVAHAAPAGGAAGSAVPPAARGADRDPAVPPAARGADRGPAAHVAPAAAAVPPAVANAPGDAPVPPRNVSTLALIGCPLIAFGQFLASL